jgi:hypothetical protein
LRQLTSFQPLTMPARPGVRWRMAWASKSRRRMKPVRCREKRGRDSLLEGRDGLIRYRSHVHAVPLGHVPVMGARHSRAARLKVNVLLPEREQLALAQAGVEGHHEQGRSSGLRTVMRRGTSSGRRESYCRRGTRRVSTEARDSQCSR